SPTTNPYNSTAGPSRVDRGGGWYDDATFVRVALRFYYSPTDTYLDLGFRICRTVYGELTDKAPLIDKTGGTEGETTVGSNSFSWSGSDPDGEIAGYEYRKDGGDWVEYALDTGYVWEGYPQGEHTFEVRAKDSHGAYSETVKWLFIYTPINLNALLDSGRYEEVIEKILGGEVSIAEDEKAVLLARAMAKNLQEGGSERYLQPVMDNLEKARLQFPRSPQIRAGMAELYLVIEEFEKARSELNEARRLGLEESWIVSLTARLNLATQGLRTARETLEEAVITGDAETLKESAGIYLEIGDSDRALELVREAREKEPENVSIARKEIEILRQTDRKEEALEVVEWALEIEPENESLLVSKVELLYETGQIEEALKFLEEVAGRIAPENVELLRLKAMILEELGNLEEVIEVLSRAIELSPEDVSLKNYYIMVGGEESERSALLEEDRKEVPEITLLTPKLPYTDRSNVIIKVKVSDNVGIEEVRINGEREATYYGKGTMQLAKRLELEGGENEVKIEALDMAGNRTSFTFSVFRDTLNPEIITEEPVYVKTTPDDITILFKDDTILSSISFNSEKIDIADREYSLTKTVQLEDSIMLRLLAEDIVGNYTEKTLQIIMDTEAPTVIVRNIPSTVEPEIDRQEIQLYVTDNRGIRRITLNSDELTPVDTIVAVVDLNPGKNDFELIAEDLAGNKTIHSFEIERIIKQQPAITVENPQTDQVTERRYTVKGRISNYRKDTVILSLNGIERAIPVINGEFSYELILETGTNTITITADNYGLKDSRTITVNLAIAQPVSEQQVVTTESRDISEALWIELTWDKDLADIDLHVYEPDEEHVYYENMKGAG
ncbi:MAG: tetratricopeptide repeat protein, partial [Thermotogaceae bacterium]|nr:tetratricopeptide repeat protein [Thermotogaceae bacterium]